MKKLLILIIAIVCLGFFLVFAGVPIVPVTGFLKGAGILAAILVGGTIIGTFLLIGMFYASIILCVALPMFGGLFLGWFFENVFFWRSELIFWLGFILTGYLCSYPLYWLYSLVGTLG